MFISIGYQTEIGCVKLALSQPFALGPSHRNLNLCDWLFYLCHSTTLAVCLGHVQTQASPHIHVKLVYCQQLHLMS